MRVGRRGLEAGLDTLGPRPRRALGSRPWPRSPDRRVLDRARAEAEAIKRALTETIEQLAQDDRTFTRATLVFTESDERCGLTAELDGVKREGVPLSIESSSSKTPRPGRAPAPSSRKRSGSTSGG